MKAGPAIVQDGGVKDPAPGSGAAALAPILPGVPAGCGQPAFASSPAGVPVLPVPCGLSSGGLRWPLPGLPAFCFLPAGHGW